MERIENYAFYGCKNLIEVVNHSPYLTIEKGETSNGYVGDCAWAVYNSEDNYEGSGVSNDNGLIVFSYDEQKVLLGYTGTATELILPSCITSIYSSAFSGCTSLTSVVIGENVDDIGDGAFQYCTSLTSVVIGENVDDIGNGAFYGCTSLTSVVIGENVEEIGDYAFYGCTSLTSVVIGDKVEDIGERAFRNCTSLTSVVIGENVEYIGEYAFYGCTSLTSATFKNPVYFVNSVGDFIAFTDAEEAAQILRSSYSYFYAYL